MATAKLPDDEGGGRVFVRSKSNVGPDGGGFRYELRQDELDGEHRGIIASRVEWGPSIDGTAREILANAEAEACPSERSERVEAATWLKEKLEEAGGEMLKTDLIKAAECAGYKERTMHRARAAAGVEVNVTGFGKAKQSLWRLGEGASVSSNHAIHATQNGGTNGTNDGADGDPAAMERF